MNVRSINRIISINEFCEIAHENNVKAGWWNGTITRETYATKIALTHSEISEALEGIRKPKLKDKHLPHRLSVEVELADAMIRIADLAAALDLDIEGAIFEKMEYNKKRDDHKLENRSKENGKKF